MEEKAAETSDKFFIQRGKKYVLILSDPLFLFITCLVIAADCQEGTLSSFLTVFIPQVIFSSVDPHPSLCTKVERFLLLSFTQKMNILSEFSQPHDPKRVVFIFPWYINGGMKQYNSCCSILNVMGLELSCYNNVN